MRGAYFTNIFSAKEEQVLDSFWWWQNLTTLHLNMMKNFKPKIWCKISEQMLLKQNSIDWLKWLKVWFLVVSISPTLYEQLFRTKVFWAAFFLLRLRFIIFRHKEISAKAAHKMLMKLTPVLILTLILYCICRKNFQLLKQASKWWMNEHKLLSPKW